jgi:hypothetical protein
MSYNKVMNGLASLDLPLETDLDGIRIVTCYSFFSGIIQSFREQVTILPAQ